MRLQIAYEIPLDNLVNYGAYSLPKKKRLAYIHTVMRTKNLHHRHDIGYTLW